MQLWTAVSSCLALSQHGVAARSRMFNQHEVSCHFERREDPGDEVANRTRSKSDDGINFPWFPSESLGRQFDIIIILENRKVK